MCLLKTDACLIQVLFNVFACLENWIHACSIQVACLIDVSTKTGFTLCLTDSLSVCISVCLGLCLVLSVCLSDSLCLSDSVFVCLILSLSDSFSVCLSV